MGNGRYCDKHGEWAPDGQCRWCEPAPTPLPPAEPEIPEATDLAVQMYRAQMQSAQMTPEQALQKFPLEDVPVTPPAADCYAGTAQVQERNNKFAEIGRVFYTAVRLQQESKATCYDLAEAIGLCEQLAASETKQPAPAGKRHEPHTYDSEVKHHTGLLAHCPCGCCCS